MEQNGHISVEIIKKRIVRLVLCVSVQILFIILLTFFANGLLSLGAYRIPNNIIGYKYGSGICMLTIFTPIMTVWNLNEAVDEAKKQEPLDWEALLLQLSEICRKALRRLPGALLVIPFLFLVEWMQAGTLHSIPLAVVYALLVLLDFWMVRRFWSMLPLPEAAPKPEPGKPVLRSQEQADDLLSLQKGARNFLFLGAVEFIIVAIPLVQAGLSLQMISLRPRLTANILTLLGCGWLAVEIILCGRGVYEQVGALPPGDGKDLLEEKLADLMKLLKTAREKVIMTVFMVPLALIADLIRSNAGTSLPWFGLAVVYYLLFELLWRRYKKQVEQVAAEI